MNKSLLGIKAALIAASLAGCATPYSEAPLATNFQTTHQLKAQAAAHWNIIANDVAKQITTKLPDKRGLFVAQPTSPSSFSRAFGNQLTSALVSSGNTVLKNSAGALTVEVDTQVVTFSPSRPQYRHAGTATALTSGVWALHVGEATGGAALFATIAAADAYAWFKSEFATGETPQTEIIVTTSISDSSQYYARNTSIYYVADSDKALYEALPTRSIKIIGGE